MESVNWLKATLSKVPSFVDRLEGGIPGYFRYSLSGDCYSESVTWGLTPSVFAAKIYYMLYALDERKMNNLQSFIRRFERPDGTIYDAFLLRKSFFPALITSFLQRDGQGLFNRGDMVKRAETRQSCAALLCLNAHPAAPYRRIPETAEDVRIFLNSLSWHLPWNAGSHLSHLLFFLHYNHHIFGLYQDSYEMLINEVLDFLSSIQSSSDGLWYKGSNVDMTQKINGAMKVLTGFSVIAHANIPYREKIIDFCLPHQNDNGACCSLDVLFVLYYCSRRSLYRYNEIEEYALKKIDQFRSYYHEAERGFSFYKNRANVRVYGAKVSRGKNEPDIHGTVLYVWGLIMVAEILKLNDVPCRQPIT